MSLYALGNMIPKVEVGTYISPAAHVIGDVHIGPTCWIGPGAVIRGDFGHIEIGSCTAIEENCVIHCYPDRICCIGNYVTIGHGALIHGMKIENYASVGMGASVGLDAVLREWSVIGEGAVVRARQAIPAYSIAVGSPAKVIGTLDDERKAFWEHGKKLYVELVQRYLDGLRPL